MPLAEAPTVGAGVCTRALRGLNVNAASRRVGPAVYILKSSKRPCRAVRFLHSVFVIRLMARAARAPPRAVDKFRCCATMANRPDERQDVVMSVAPSTSRLRRPEKPGSEC